MTVVKYQRELKMHQKFAKLANRTSLSCMNYHEDLKKLMQSINSFIFCQTEQEFEYGMLAFSNSLYQLLQKFFSEYTDPLNHEDPGQFLDAQIAKGRVSFDDFLEDIVARNDEEMRHFKSQYPYFQVLIDMHLLRTSSKVATAGDLLTPLADMRNQLATYLIQFEVILPLQVLCDAIKEVIRAYQTQDFDTMELFMTFIRAHITKYNIPNDQRFKGRDTEKFYNAVNWRNIGQALEAISKDNPQVECDVIADLTTLLKQLTKVIRVERGDSVAVPEHAGFAAIEAVAAGKNDQLNLDYMKTCISELLSENPADSLTSRMAVLQLFIIIGECANNLSQPLLDACPTLCKFKTLRKHLVHPEIGARNFRIVDSLLRNKSGAYLDHILTNELNDFYMELERLSSGDRSASTLQMPKTIIIHDAMSKIQKLSNKQLRWLRSTLPKHDVIKTSTKRHNMELILRGAVKLPNANNFNKQFKNHGISAKKLKTMHSRLQLRRVLNYLQSQIIQQELSPSEALTEFNELLDLRFKKTDPLYIWITNLLKMVAEPVAIIAASNVLLQTKALISEQDIQTILTKVPNQDTNITGIKKILLDVIYQRSPLIAKQEFDRYLEILKLPAGARRHWDVAFARLNSDDKKVVESNKPTPEVTCAQIQQNIDAMIKEFTRLQTLRVDQDEVPPSLCRAYEFSLGQFLRHAKYLSNNLDLFKDFSDVRARSIFLKHPIDELRAELKSYLRFRNEVFHVKHLYQASLVNSNSWMRTQRLVQFVEHLTVGHMFPQAIIIDGPTVSRGPVRSTSVLQRLKSARHEVTQYQKKITELKQQAYWQDANPLFLFARTTSEQRLHDSAFVAVKSTHSRS